MDRRYIIKELYDFFNLATFSETNYQEALSLNEEWQNRYIEIFIKAYELGATKRESPNYLSYEDIPNWLAEWKEEPEPRRQRQKNKLIKKYMILWRDLFNKAAQKEH